MSRHQFRLLVVLNQFLIVAAIVVQEITDGSLPPELRSYLGIDESVLDTQIVSVTPLSDVPYWLGIVVILMGLAASIGLCLGKRWGRSLFVVTFVVALVTTLFTDFYLNTGWTAFVSYLAGSTEGMIIALAYFSPVRRMFKRSEETLQGDAAEQTNGKG
jgi:hypothetical protein